jgi:hypothetical protein
MNTESQDPLLDGITYRDNLPINWEVLPTPLSAGETHRLDRANEELLHNLLLRDEVSQEMEEMEEMGGQEHLKRLEAKLDLLLSLVMEMMTEKRNHPRQRALIIGTHGLYVYTQEEDMATIKDGALLRIRLYLDAQFPRPLHICGRLTNLQADGFTVTFPPLEARFQDLLDKFVFRQHRRAVALARRGENP